MKQIRNYSVRMALAMAAAVSLNGVAFAANDTALELAKAGNQYVGDQSKDRLVQIRSERSVGELTPRIWYVVYYDPTATLKAVEVKFSDGKMVDVQRPLRLLEPVTGGDLPLDRDKVRIDSDQAFRTASRDPGLANTQLTSVKFKLERVGEGVLGRGAGEPVWKLEFWGSRQGTGHEAHLGEVWVSANDGKVIKADLH
jgi:hypothetical protein